MFIYCIRNVVKNFFKRDGSYIDSADRIKSQKALINPFNKNDNKYFQYAVTVALNHDEIKQKWNCDERRCECKELDDWGSCEKISTWNPSTCGCKCNKACKIDEYLDTKNFSYKKSLTGKLLLACEDVMLNKIDYRKITCEEHVCLFHYFTVSLFHE